MPYLHRQIAQFLITFLALLIFSNAPCQPLSNASNTSGAKKLHSDHKSSSVSNGNRTCSKRLRIAINPQSPALTVNAQQQTSGILSDFFAALEENTGCSFSWDFVPRARAIHYLQHGLTDIVFAIKTEERDRYAEFVPLLEFYPSLIVSNELSRLDDSEKLLENEQLRFGFVRGYNFGKDYLEFVERIKRAKRGEEIGEIEDIASKMAQGQINASIMSATVFVQAARDILLDQKIQAIPLKQFPKARVGIYLANQTMSPDDKRIMRDAISNKANIDLFYRLFKAHYPAWAMKAIAPVPSTVPNTAPRN